MPPQLKSTLAACSLLVGVAEPPPKLTSQKDSLSSILLRRLQGFHDQLGLVQLPTDPTERQLKLTTAQAASKALQLIASLVEERSEPAASTSTAQNAPQAPVFGVRDVKVLSMLSGIVARWGVGLKVDEGVLPSGLVDRPPPRSKITELVEEGEDTGDPLSETVQGLLHLTRISKDSSEGAKQLAGIVAPQVLLPLIGGLVQLGYAPTQHAEGGWAREALQQLCSSTNPAIIISNLLALLSSPPSATKKWLSPAVSSLLSSQLLRPNGVRALLLVVVGAGTQGGGEDEIGVKKLDMLSRLLVSKAPHISADVYCSSITSQLLAILQSASSASLSPSTSPPAPPTTILRASAFVLSHMLLSPKTSDATIVAETLLPALHAPFLPGLYSPPPPPPAEEELLALPPPIIDSSKLLHSLTTLSLLLLHSPPLPGFLSTLILPILPSLLSLAAFTAPAPEEGRGKVRISAQDERFDDETRAILEVWGRSAGVEEGVKEVGRAVEAWEGVRELGGGGEEGQGGGMGWAWDDEGGVCVRKKDGEEEQGGAVDAESVVQWLKEVGRKELSSALFLRWLGELQALRSQPGFSAAKRSVTRLQLVLKMVEHLGEGLLTVEDATGVIAFVAHALEADDLSTIIEEDPAPPPKRAPKPREGFGLADLKIVEDDEMEGTRREKEREQEEEQDNQEETVTGLGRDEMAMTALTLLLAVLEANPDLTTSNTPLLALLFAKLDHFASSETSELVPPLAREAKMVLTLRQASSFAPDTPSDSSTADDPLAASRQTYQQALKLLQDPLLPVRAQGLAQLRSLIATKDAFLATDPALLPAVLDILVLALEEEDSFLYLNAIQGLSKMADVQGAKVVKRLVRVYLGGEGEQARRNVGKGEKGRRELDKRLRMGEALNQVVQRAGEALAVFVDHLVPSLLFVLRTSTLPTPLRSSALTILATCIETSPLALMPHANLLTEACLTLLSVESVPLQPRKRDQPPPVPKPRTEGSGEDSDEEEEPVKLGSNGKPRRPEETPDPISHIDSKHPSLRRAAILFLGLLFRTAANLSAEKEQQSAGYDEINPLGALVMPGGGSLSTRSSVGQPTASSMLVGREEKERARTVLRYLRETDEDGLVRHQAGEVLDELETR